MKELILRCALENAVKYSGKADFGSVLGAVFARDKKADKKKVIGLAKDIVNEVNSLSLREQEERLKKVGHVKKIRKKKKEVSLENVKGKVIMRFAPNPSGYMSFGHARPGLWNEFLVKKYKGSYLLRMDDTDPRIKVPLKEAYKEIKKDLEWLGVKPSKVVIQSKRLNIYYKYAEKLIEMGKAYVDTLPSDVMRKMLWERKISDEREEGPETVMKKWKKMFTSYEEGCAVLRIKTDITHPNPAVRDWPAFRIIKNGKHPLIKARVWPLLNFASAIDDHEFSVTHILRGADLEVSDERQRYIYDYFKWKYPETMYHGKFFISGIKSTSEALELIKEGKLRGWDDPRLGTIAALRKRGFQSEAIVGFIKDVGIGKADVNVNVSSLASCNKDIVDKKAERYFVVLNPKKIKIRTAPSMNVKVPLHPDYPKRGFRKFGTSDEFYVDEVFEPGQIYRFIDLFNFKDLKFVSKTMSPKLGAKLIHWLPVGKGLVKVELFMPDGSIKKGLGEGGLKKVKVNEVVQFMRIGFVRCDKKSKDKMVFYFGHR
ncbi:MAG: glutamate--tRNA ligase [Candidatus Woesearchaeota archaeon]